MLACCWATASLPQQSGETNAEPNFDPEPFLRSMIEYRLLAQSCEETLPGSPLDGSSEIARFFVSLGQSEPTGSNKSMDRIISAVIRPQAAAICSKRLREAAVRYGSQAVLYEKNKPSSWPVAPSIDAGPWCSEESCASLR